MEYDCGWGSKPLRKVLYLGSIYVTLLAIVGNSALITYRGNDSIVELSDINTSDCYELD